MSVTGMWLIGAIPDREASDLLTLIDDADSTVESSEAVWDACMDLMGDDGVLVVTARKASPFEALCYALGPDSTSLLPGRSGNFLLSHSEVTTRLAHIEQALQLTGAPRAQALQRISTWMKDMGDAPDFEAEELLDGPLRVLRHAAVTSCGAAAFTRWY